jgi:E3 ubiquitin-protein ligase BRE1
LDDKGKTLRSRVEAICSRLSNNRGQVTPEISALESKISNLLAAQKDYLVKLERLNSEKEQLSTSLDDTSLRALKAERKLQRYKSQQVQKLEQQARAGSNRPTVQVGENGSEGDGVNGDISETLARLEEASAVVTKQKEQLDAALTEIKGLHEENSTLKAKRDVLTDEDFIRTDVFKQFKGQNEDLIKRINHLEATNKQLREEAEKMQAERSTFQTSLEAAAQTEIHNLEEEVRQRDLDLARVRSARDEYVAEVEMRKQAEKQEKTAIKHMKELVLAKDERIAALESEAERLQPVEERNLQSPNTEEIEKLSLEELRGKCIKLEKDFYMINTELPGMTTAYKRSVNLAQKKVMDFAALEERVKILTAEKAKADQKYFAAQKNSDTRNSELLNLRRQNAKSSEIIAQLKEVETHNRALLSNLDKQLTDLKHANAVLVAEGKKLDASSSDAVRRSEALKVQLAELSNAIKNKDASTAAMKERTLTCEAEAERLRVRVEHIGRDRDTWKTKALSNSSEEEEMLRVSAPILLEFYHSPS